MPADAKAAIELLKELRALTGDAAGAQRVAWTPTWLKAREWFQSKLARAAHRASLRCRGQQLDHASRCELKRLSSSAAI